MSTTKFAYKVLPPFNPTFYRSWASDVNDAFAERDWTNYLESSVPETDLNPQIVIKAKAFLNQSISYEYKAGLEDCTTAAQIWLALQQRYASKSREDELRLEGQLLDFKKSATDSIDQHIAKFDILIASIMAQQPTGQRYDDTKKNRYFLRTLETAQIPNEDWKGFITFLGKSWLTITTHALFAEARTYYNTHIQPYIGNTPSSNTPSSNIIEPPTDASAYTIQSSNYDNSSSNSSPRNFNNQPSDPTARNNHNSDDSYHDSQFNNDYNDNDNDNDNITYNSRSRLPLDSSLWCPYCRRKGHSYEQCYSKERDPDYQQFMRSKQEQPAHHAQYPPAPPSHRAR